MTQVPGGRGDEWLRPAALIASLQTGITVVQERNRDARNKAERQLKNCQALTTNKATIPQFVRASLENDLNKNQIKQQLVDWGGKANGINYGNPDNFDVQLTTAHHHVWDRFFFLGPPKQTI